jgi:hypothetical protein
MKMWVSVHYWTFLFVAWSNERHVVFLIVAREIIADSDVGVPDVVPLGPDNLVQWSLHDVVAGVQPTAVSAVCRRGEATVDVGIRCSRGSTMTRYLESHVAEF